MWKPTMKIFPRAYPSESPLSIALIFWPHNKLSYKHHPTVSFAYSILRRNKTDLRFQAHVIHSFDICSPSVSHGSTVLGVWKRGYPSGLTSTGRSSRNVHQSHEPEETEGRKYKRHPRRGSRDTKQISVWLPVTCLRPNHHGRVP